jgi:hypothetical protein
MFVLQSPSANLYALRARIARGLECRGPALFSVFTGSPASASRLPPYLSAAAALQSRAFPAFSYDADAGANWAARFSLENNPQPDDDWPIEALDYHDAALQRESLRCAFTFADFVLCDTRHAAHFALVAHERWTQAMLPVADWLALAEAEAAQHVPYLLAVDADDALQACDRRRAPDARDTSLPAAVAPPARARRRARLACRAPARHREGRMDGAAGRRGAGACYRTSRADCTRRGGCRTSNRPAGALAR